NRHRAAVHGAEKAREVGALEGEELGERRAPLLHRAGEDRLAHGADLPLAEEHVLGAAEAHALGPEGERVGALVGLVRVGAHAEAACLVMPPRAVKMPWAAFMPPMSSGEVSMRTRMTGSPAAARRSASSALNTTRPLAAPGPALSPLAISRFSCTVRSFSRASKIGRRSWLSCSGSTRRKASSREMRRSRTMS